MNDTITDLHRTANAALRNPWAPDAIPALEALAAAEPVRADNWFNLAYLYRVHGRYTDALKAYETALTNGIDHPEEVHLNRSVIYAEFLDDPGQARKELQSALSLNPKFLPSQMNLGLLHEDDGEVALAAAVYRQVLEVDNNHPEALARLARLEPANSINIDRIRKLLDRGNLPLDMVSELYFSLASIFDRSGDYDGAFAAATQANRMAASVIPAHLAYSRARMDDLVKFASSFDVAPLDMIADEPTPIFVCGMFRSGSTLAEAMLGRHDAITACGEREMLPRCFAASSVADMQRKADPAFLADALDIYRSGVRHLNVTTPYFTDKRPDNILHMAYAKALFANAKIVITRRDPLDNLISCYFCNFAAGVPYATELDDICHWAVHSKNLTDAWLTRWPDDTSVIGYENLIRSPQNELKWTFETLNLDWQDSCLDPSRPIRPTRTPSSIQIRQDIYSSSMDRWKNYSKYIGRQIEFFQKVGMMG